MRNVGSRNKRRIMLTLTLTHSLVLNPQGVFSQNIEGSKGGSRRTGLLLFCECLRDFSRPECVARNSRINSEKWFGKAVERSGNGLVSGIRERDWGKLRQSWTCRLTFRIRSSCAKISNTRFSKMDSWNFEKYVRGSGLKCMCSSTCGFETIKHFIIQQMHKYVIRRYN